MAITSYGSLYAKLKRKQTNIDENTALLKKLPEIVVEAVRIRLGIPHESIHFGWIDDKKQYRQGETKIDSGILVCDITVEFPTPNVKFVHHINFVATVDKKSYYLSFGVDKLEFLYEPKILGIDLDEVAELFSFLLQEKVDAQIAD